MVLLVTLEKIAILVPPKLSSELELRSTFLGQFWRYSDGIFSKVTRRTMAISPRMIHFSMTRPPTQLFFGSGHP